MTFRVFVKSLRLSIRTGKRFWFFVAIYAILIGWTAINLDNLIKGADFLPVLFLLIVVAVLSLIYGLIISSYRKLQVATLRCLGWTSADIKWLFIGELILVIFVAAFIDLEIIIHYLGIGYYLGLNPPILGAGPFAITFLVILGVQFLGVFVAWRRMLKVRPMEALRKL
ncbi:MAG: FtsX-like permease family protein [Candidatus Helarchaeota archaeon]